MRHDRYVNNFYFSIQVSRLIRAYNIVHLSSSQGYFDMLHYEKIIVVTLPDVPVTSFKGYIVLYWLVSHILVWYISIALLSISYLDPYLIFVEYLDQCLVLISGDLVP